MCVVYNGTVKSFLNETAIENRNTTDVYELICSGHRKKYQFINGVEDKCFKRVDKSTNTGINPLFDIRNLDDLPDDLKKRFFKKKKNKYFNNAYYLFEEVSKNTILNFDQLLIGYYRKYGKIVKGPHLSFQLRQLIKAHKITRVGKGLYCKL